METYIKELKTELKEKCELQEYKIAEALGFTPTGYSLMKDTYKNRFLLSTLLNMQKKTGLKGLSFYTYIVDINNWLNN